MPWFHVNPKQRKMCLYLAVWRVRGVPSPLEVDTSSLLLNSFGVGCPVSYLKKKGKKKKVDVSEDFSLCTRFS